MFDFISLKKARRLNGLQPDGGQPQRTWRDSGKARARPLFFAAYLADFSANFKDAVKFAVCDSAFHKFRRLCS